MPLLPVRFNLKSYIVGTANSKKKKEPWNWRKLKKRIKKKERKRKHLTFSSVLEGEGLPSGMDAALKWTIVDKLITMKAKMGEIRNVWSSVTLKSDSQRYWFKLNTNSIKF